MQPVALTTSQKPSNNYSSTFQYSNTRSFLIPVTISTSDHHL